jgi:hypothetical protein
MFRVFDFDLLLMLKLRLASSYTPRVSKTRKSRTKTPICKFGGRVPRFYFRYRLSFTPPVIFHNGANGLEFGRASWIFHFEMTVVFLFCICVFFFLSLSCAPFSAGWIESFREHVGFWLAFCDCVFHVVLFSRFKSCRPSWLGSFSPPRRSFSLSLSLSLKGEHMQTTKGGAPRYPLGVTGVAYNGRNHYGPE